jgi:hypothetical protein
MLTLKFISKVTWDKDRILIYLIYEMEASYTHTNIFNKCCNSTRQETTYSPRASLTPQAANHNFLFESIFRSTAESQNIFRNYVNQK